MRSAVLLAVLLVGIAFSAERVVAWEYFTQTG
jgi:hypothetical protein